MFMRILFAFFLGLSCLGIGYSQAEMTVSGYIKDASNGETLIGATAYVKEVALGAVSNEYGFYSISVEPGEYEIEFSYLGFVTKTQSISLEENVTLSVELALEGEMIDEVVITSEAEDKNVSQVEMSVNKLNIQTIKSMPALLGEVEIIRSLQLLPGVTAVGEGATGFNVRGGSIDQNLVLLDEAPVYNSSHLFGFFSVFNPDAVKDVKLYKGGIPARYGGRLSSILDVRMKEGNSKKLEINGGIGFIFSRLSVEAPIIKDKASFIVAARRSYIDILAKPFLSGDLGDTALNFYDLTLKTNYNINEKNRVYLSGYFGRDNFGFGDDAGFSWGNNTGSIRWNHIFTDKLFGNTTLFYSNYDYKIKFGDDSDNQFTWNAAIQNASAKQEFSFFLNPNNMVRFGGQSIYYIFEPGTAIAVSEGESLDISLDKKFALENALYIENEQDIGLFKINYGLRSSFFNYLGEGTSYELAETEPGERKEVVSVTEFERGKSIANYARLEPRASVKYQVNNTSSLKASYNRTVQYIHLISNTTASTPIDVWTPTSNNIKPQEADQVALGFFKNLDNNTYELSTEVYYKTFKNLVDYIDGAELLLNNFLEADLLEGKGRAYGLELQIEKKKGDFTGWLSYTLARSERQIEGINKNQWYPTRFDQLHNVSATGFYELNDKWSFSAVFSYITGTPVTFATSRYQVGDYLVPHNANDTRNNVRIPSYHRLDLSATLKGRSTAKWEDEWVFSVYNAYNRRNPFSIYFKQDDARAQEGIPISTEAVQLSVIGNFIPSISYNFKFK